MLGPMSDSARASKTSPNRTSEPKSGVRPTQRMPGEGALIPAGRHGDGPTKIKRKGLSLRTREVYRRDWGRFASWCKTNRVQALPCRPETLIRYLDERAAQCPRTVLYRELIVICRTHRAEGERSPRQYPLVRKWLRNYRDDAGLSVPSAAAIQTAHLVAMAARLHQAAQSTDESPKGQRKRLAAIRDRALILVGKAAQMRRLDIRRLTMGDVTVTAAGLEVTLRRSKLLGGRTVATLARKKPVSLCPVDAWQAWAAAAPATPDAPAFRVLGTSGAREKAIGPTDICIVIKRAIHAVGVDPTPYTDESLAAV